MGKDRAKWEWARPAEEGPMSKLKSKEQKYPGQVGKEACGSVEQGNRVVMGGGGQVYGQGQGSLIGRAYGSQSMGQGSHEVKRRGLMEGEGNAKQTGANGFVGGGEGRI